MPRIATARRITTSMLAGQLVLVPMLAVAAPAPAPSEAPPRPSDEFAPIAITPVELPEPLPSSEPPVDTDEPPVDTDEPPVDTDEPPIDSDEPPVDTDLDVDDEPIEDDYDLLRDSAAARDARRWTRAGIASTVAGAVLIAGGIIMGTSEPCDPQVGNNCFRDSRDRAALTMGVPGGVLLLGGIAMITTGELQKKRLRAQLILSRERIGIGISGRF